MKKILLLVLSLVLSLTLVCALVACDQTEAPPPKPYVSITLDKQNLKLCLGGSATLSATVENSKSQVSWHSSKNSVATVTNGVVSAVGAGSAVITAHVDNISAQCAVTVTGEAAIIKPFVSTVLLGVGQAYDLSVQTMFEGQILQGQSYSWTSQGQSVSATYNDDKDVVTFVGVAEGSSTFTASTVVCGVTFYSNVSVQVVDNSTTWMLTGENLSPDGAKGYVANLNIGQTTQITPTVWRNDTKAQNLEFSWSSSATDVVSNVGNQITAVSEGTSVVSCQFTIDGKSYSIPITVNSVRPTYVVETPHVLQTYDSQFVVKDVLEGTILGAELCMNNSSGFQNVFTSASGNVIALDNEKLVFERDDMGAGKQMRISTDTAHYLFTDVSVYDKVITTAEEFKNLATYMRKSVGEDNFYQYTGYVVLGNDIDLEGASFVMFQQETVPNTTAGDTNGKNVGFNGILDGNGHVVSNYKAVSGQFTAMFTIIGKSAVIKNIGITNINSTGVTENTRILTYVFNGLMQDVYISLDAWTGGYVIPSGFGNGQFLQNVVIHYTGERIDGTRAVNYQCHAPNSAKNAYFIGDVANVDTNCDYTSATYNHDVCYHVYKNYAELYNENKDFSMFSASIWNNQHKVPILNSIASEQESKDIVIENDDAVVAPSSQINLKANTPYVLWTLQGEFDGVTLDENVISIASNAPNGQVSVVATNMFNSQKIAAYTFEVSQATAKSKSVSHLELGNSSQEPQVQISIADVGNYQEILNVKLEGNAVGYNLSNNVLSIAKADLASALGKDVAISILAKTVQGDYHQITLSTKLVTKVITTATEFQNLASYMDKSVGEGNLYQYTGYMLLGNDINLQDASFNMFTEEKVDASQTTTRNNTNMGFNGTLDGNGHIISNYKATAGGNGLFANIGKSGVIQNIGLTEITAVAVNYSNPSQILTDVFNGLMQDVYISIDTWVAGKVIPSWYGSGQNLQNVVINYTGEPIDGAREISRQCHLVNSVKNTYFIGNVTTVETFCDSTLNSYDHDLCYKIYKSYNEMYQAGNDVSMFTASIWTRNDVPPMFSK